MFGKGSFALQKISDSFNKSFERETEVSGKQEQI
jgi:hypothetical protein